MMKRLSMLTLVLMLAGVALFPLATTRAQDGEELSEEELETLDYAISLIEGIEDFDSMQYEVINSESLSLELTDGEAVLQSFGEQVVNSISITLIAEGDGEANMQGNIQGLYSETQNGEDVASALLEAEVRRVDGQVYVNGSVMGPGGAGYPEGWTMVADSDEAEELYPNLSLDLFTAPYGSEDNFIFQTDLLRDSVISITSASQEQDGEAMEVINIELDATIALPAEEGEEANPLQVLFTEEAELTLNILVQDDRISTIITSLSIELEDYDASILGDDIPEGTLMNLTGENGLIIQIADINSEYEAAEAPEMDME